MTKVKAKVKITKKKTAKKPGSRDKKLPTYVTLLLDESGSMQAILEPTLEGVNTFIDGLRKDKNVRFSLVKFDDPRYEVVCENAKLEDVKNLTKETFIPRGCTPLIDAAYRTIKNIENHVKDMKKDSYKVAVCIQTDGMENASKEKGWKDLKELIEAKTKLGWGFSFIGASLDAFTQKQMYAQAAAMGIMRANTVAYDSKSAGSTRSLYSSLARNTTAFAASGSPKVGTTEFDFTHLQKQGAGDVVDVNVDVKVKQKKKSS